MAKTIRFIKDTFRLRQTRKIQLVQMQQREFCSSGALYVSESKVQALLKNNDLKGSILEFERKPTPFDAFFLIKHKGLPFETGLKVFNQVKDKKKIYPLIAIINACYRNNRRKEF